MKKVLLFSAAILALSSCSNTDVLEEGNIQQTNAIGFQTLVNKESRAITVDNFDQFLVYGSYKVAGSDVSMQLFNGVPVTKSGNSWTYTDTRYWIEGGTYTFSAYAVDDDALPSGANANFRDSKYLNITNFRCDESVQKDLVYARIVSYGPARATGNPVQSLNFEHVLARIQFKFENQFPADYNVKVADLEVINVRNYGNFYGSQFYSETVNCWVKPDGQGITDEYTVPTRYPNDQAKPTVKPALSDANATIASGSSATTDFAYVIPYKYSDANVKISFHIFVTRTVGAETVNVFDKVLTASICPEWKMSHSYCYTIGLSGNSSGLDPIVFSGSVEDWNPVEEGEKVNIDAGHLPSQD